MKVKRKITLILEVIIDGGKTIKIPLIEDLPVEIKELRLDELSIEEILELVKKYR